MQDNNALELKADLKNKPVEPTDYQVRFAQARKAAGLSLKAVAEASGVSLQAIGQFERGLQSLNISVFLKACQVMHVNTSYTLHGTGNMWAGERPKPTIRGGRPADRSK